MTYLLDERAHELNNAIDRGPEAISSYIKDHGTTFNPPMGGFDDHILMLVIRAYDLDTVTLFVDALKLSLDIKNHDGMTPVMVAASQGNYEIVEWLVEEKKCPLDAKDNEGNSIVMTTAIWSASTCFNYMRRALDYAREHKDEYGNGILLSSDVLSYISEKFEKIFDFLIHQHRCSVNEVNNDGNTTLDLIHLYRDESGSAPMFEIVLEHMALQLAQEHKTISVNGAKTYIISKFLRDNRDNMPFRRYESIHDHYLPDFWKMPWEEKKALLLTFIKIESLDEDSIMAACLAKRYDILPANSIIPRLISRFNSTDIQNMIASLEPSQAVDTILLNHPMSDRNINLLSNPAESSKKMSQHPVADEIAECWMGILKVSHIDFQTPFNQLPNANKDAWLQGLKNLAYYYQIDLSGTIDNLNVSLLAKVIQKKIEDARTVRLLHRSYADTDSSKGPALFFIHPIMGDDAVFRSAKDNISNLDLDKLNCSAYTLSSPLLNDELKIQNFNDYNSLQYQAQLAIRAMYAVHPNGPYYLCGYSYGGALTLEIARQLQADGVRVNYLGLIDPLLPHQFQNLSGDDLKHRISQHLSFICCYLLGLDIQKKPFLVPQEIAIEENSQIAIINQAIKIVADKLRSQYETHPNKNKLIAIFRAIQANYLAMQNYPDKQSPIINSQAVCNVFVASDRADNMRYREYYPGDLRAVYQAPFSETSLDNMSHFSIISSRSLTAHIVSDLQNNEQEITALRFRECLVNYYQQHLLNPISLPFDNRKIDIHDCSFSDCREYMIDEARLVITGGMGVGKTVFAKQLVSQWISNNAPKDWPMKHYVFYLPMDELLTYPYDTKQAFIPQILYYQFFKANGATLEMVKEFWITIQSHPERISFIIDEIEFLKKNDLQLHILNEIKLQPIQLIVFSREQNYHPLREHSFKFINLAPFTSQQVTAFAKKHFHIQAQAFIDWLKKEKLEDLACKPVYLSLLASIWNCYHNNDDMPTFIDVIRVMILHSLKSRKNQSHRIDLVDNDSILETNDKILIFLQNLAYFFIHKGSNMLSLKDIKWFLNEFYAGDALLFGQALQTGFLFISPHKSLDMDKHFQFEVELFQIYLACMHAQNLQQIDSNFITNLLKISDTKTIRSFLLDNLSKEQLYHLSDSHKSDIKLLQLIQEAIIGNWRRNNLSKQTRCDSSLFHEYIDSFVKTLSTNPELRLETLIYLVESSPLDFHGELLNAFKLIPYKSESKKILNQAVCSRLSQSGGDITTNDDQAAALCAFIGSGLDQDSSIRHQLISYISNPIELINAKRDKCADLLIIFLLSKHHSSYWSEIEQLEFSRNLDELVYRIYRPTKDSTKTVARIGFYSTPENHPLCQDSCRIS